MSSRVSPSVAMPCCSHWRLMLSERTACMSSSAPAARPRRRVLSMRLYACSLMPCGVSCCGASVAAGALSPGCTGTAAPPAAFAWARMSATHCACCAPPSLWKLASRLCAIASRSAGSSATLCCHWRRMVSANAACISASGSPMLSPRCRVRSALL